MSFASNQIGYGPVSPDERTVGEARQVPMELDRLHKNVAILRERVSDLSERLSSVLMPYEPEAADAPARPQPVQAPLADNIATTSAEVQAIVEQVEQLTVRLQV